LELKKQVDNNMRFLSNRLSHIRNGQFNKLPYIRYTLNNQFLIVNITKILIVLRKQGYIRGFAITEIPNIFKFKVIIYLKYTQTGKGVVNSISIVSKPGRRVYLASKALWQPQTTIGIFIVSTTQGFRTDTEARRFNLGGEILFGVA